MIGDLALTDSKTTLADSLFERKVSDNDIVPEVLQNELMQLRNADQLISFRIGDIANQLVEEAVRSGLKVPVARVFGAVGNFCGRSQRTIEEYADVAAFYPQNVRQEFDLLAFSYFSAARRLKDWHSALEWAVANPSASMESMVGFYSEKRSQPQMSTPVPESMSREEMTEISGDLSLSMPGEEENLIRSNVRLAMIASTKVSDAVEAVKHALQSIEVNRLFERRILDAIETLQRSMPDLLDIAKRG